MEQALLSYLIRNEIHANIEKLHIDSNFAVIEMHVETDKSLINQLVLIGVWFYEHEIHYIDLELNGKNFYLPTVDIEILISTAERLSKDKDFIKSHRGITP